MEYVGYAHTIKLKAYLCGGKHGMHTRGGWGGGREEMHSRESVTRCEYGVFGVCKPEGCRRGECEAYTIWCMWGLHTREGVSHTVYRVCKVCIPNGVGGGTKLSSYPSWSIWGMHNRQLHGLPIFAIIN